MNCELMLLSQSPVYNLVMTCLIKNISPRMEGADLCIEVVRRATAGFVYSEAVAR